MKTIALVLKNKENTLLLTKYLEKHYKVVATNTIPEGDIDLIIVDQQAFKTAQLEIEKRKKLEVFLPVLLLTKFSDASILAKYVSKSIDEVLRVPVEKIELRTRIEILLRAREYSSQSQTKYYALTENIPLGVCILQNDCIVYANAAMTKTLQVTQREIIGKEFVSFLCSKYQNTLKNSIENKQIVEVKIHTNRFIELHLSKTTYKQEEALLGLLVDITERKQRELTLKDLSHSLKEAITKLQQAQKQLMQVERVRVVGEMTSGIAHDFNNFLSPIAGYSQLLLKYPDIRDDVDLLTQYLKVIHTAAQDAGKMIGRLREIYGQTPEEVPKNLDLNKVIIETIELTKPKWQEQHIKIEKKLQEIPPIKGIAFQLKQMLTNLVFNAVDAMPDGGNLAFFTQVQQSYVTLKIKDTGVGMPPKLQQDCWKTFFSTKGEQGTGLGLTMVSNVVKQHEGKINLESEQGKGTTFTIQFLLTIETGKEKIELPKQVSSLNVLVVDDDSKNLDILSVYLSKEGHIVETAKNGEEGWQKFQQKAFDLVITDKRMPEKDGKWLAKAIKKEQPQFPIILTTGFAEPREEAFFDFTLYKPIDLLKLGKIMHTLMGSSQEKKVSKKDIDVKIDFPEREKLEQLLSLIANGYFSSIEEFLESTQKNHSLFTQKIKTWVDDFQFEQAADFLKSHL